MRTLIGFTLLTLSATAQANPCELALEKLVDILSSKGELDIETGKRYKSDPITTNFNETCAVSNEHKEYALHLHSDNITVVIELTNTQEASPIYFGPFYSAYRK